MSARILAVALVTIILGIPGSVRADIVVHDGGVEHDRDAADLVLRATGQQPRMVLSGEALAGPAQMLVSNVEVEQCEGAPIALSIEPKLDSVVEAVLSFELARALEELDVLETLLPCADQNVPGALLARLSFLRGAARFDQGDEAGAQSEMKDALAMDPRFEGLRGFPQPHIDLLEAARAAAQQPVKAPLFLWSKPGAATASWIDGISVPPTPQEGAALTAGRHLIQLVDAGGRLHGMWVRTTGVEAVIVFPGAGPAVWEDGGRSPSGELAMRLVLLGAFQGRNGEVAVLRWKGRKVVGAWSYPADGGPPKRWTEQADAGTPPPVAGGPEGVGGTTTDAATTGPRAASRLRVAVGGGYQFVQPFHYGLVALDVSVRIVGPLTATAFVRPSYGGTFLADVGDRDPVQGAILLLPFGAGFGAQKADGAVSPFVYGVFQGAVNQVVPLGTFLLGGAVQGGADFAPGDGRFLVRIEGEAGFLGANDDRTGSFGAAFTARVWAGVGARF